MKFMKLAEARFLNFIWNNDSCKILYIYKLEWLSTDNLSSPLFA